MFNFILCALQFLAQRGRGKAVRVLHRCSAWLDLKEQCFLEHQLVQDCGILVFETENAKASITPGTLGWTDLGVDE